MEGFDPTVIMAVTALLMPVIGAFMAITPYLMRRGEVFTVTVPTSEQHDPYVVGLKRRYAAIVVDVKELLTAEARFDRHDKHHVEFVKDVEDRLDRFGRTDRDRKSVV